MLNMSFRRSRRAPARLLAIAAVGLVATGCRDETPPAADVVRPVKTMVVGAPAEESGRRYPGTVRPNEEVDLAFEVSGRVIELPVNRGDIVEAGTLLARLDPRDYENARDRALAKQTEAASTLERLLELKERGAAKEKEVIDAQAAADMAAAELRIAEKALSDTKLEAPFGGVVANRFFENFENVGAKQKVLSLQDVDTIKVLVDIPERDVVGLAAEVDPDLGQFTATFPTIPGRAFEMTVKEYVTEADPATQTFEIALIFPAPRDVSILPGMTASVAWIPPMVTEADARILVPSTAVFEHDNADRPAVWVIDPGTMRVGRREVDVGGVVTGNRIEVLGGLSSGELIAISGVHYLQEGTEVRPMDGSAPAAPTPEPSPG